jgi:cardiolipin synthase
VRGLFLFFGLLLASSGCGTIPNMRALLHEKMERHEHPDIVGPKGKLTEKQADQIFARLQEHQQTPSDILAKHLALEQALSDVPLTVGNKVTLLENGAATYQAMLAAIRGATDSINMQTYTFSDGPVGQTFADALIERQHHGVQVNVEYDSLGSFGTPKSFFDRMEQNGIAVLEYRPVNPFAAKLPWSFSHRNHRKVLVVDGRVAFTGGINISEVYSSGLNTSREQGPSEYWRDTDIAVEGPAVAEFQKQFIDEWNYQLGPTLSPRNYFPDLGRKGNKIVRVIVSVPQRFSLIYATMISAVVSSQTNIYITDAYFAPDPQMLHALEHAAKRGVDVRLLLPSQTDEPLILAAQHSHYTDLLEAGVKIYEWQGEMLHAKTTTIDGVWSTVGTSNLDWWSIARDNEINAIILSHSFGDDMNLMFRNDLENSQQIELDQWRHRGLVERLHETGAWIIEPLL